MSDFDAEIEQRGITYRDRTQRLRVIVRFFALLVFAFFISWMWWGAHGRQKIYTPMDLYQRVEYRVSSPMRNYYWVTRADGPPNVGKDVYFVYLGTEELQPNDTFMVADGEVLPLVDKNQ